MYTVGAQCTLGGGAGGVAGGWGGGTAERLRLQLGKEKGKESMAKVSGLKRGWGVGRPAPTRAASPPDPGRPRRSLGCGRSRVHLARALVPAGPPAASPSLPRRGPPPRGVFPAGTPAPQRRPPAAAGEAGTAGEATRPSQWGRKCDGGSSVPGKKPPLTRRWPSPQAGPASRCTRLSGAGADVSRDLYFSLSLSGSFFPPRPHPHPTARQVLGPQSPGQRAALRSSPTLPRNQPRPAL